MGTLLGTSLLLVGEGVEDDQEDVLEEAEHHDEDVGGEHGGEQGAAGESLGRVDADQQEHQQLHHHPRYFRSLCISIMFLHPFLYLPCCRLTNWDEATEEKDERKYVLGDDDLSPDSLTPSSKLQCAGHI